MRAAMGAGRERLVRQMVTESLVLAVVGGALGVLAAVAPCRCWRAWFPAVLPIAQAPAVDLRVLLFAGLLTGLTGIGFGVFPRCAPAAVRISAGCGKARARAAAKRAAALRAGDRGSDWPRWCCWFPPAC